MAEAMTGMKEELHAHANDLKGILAGYQDEIAAELLKRKNENVEVGIPQEASDAQTFHIFLVSPLGTESGVLINWLMGLFEPDKNPTELITSPEMRVYQLGEEVPISATIVTQTQETDLLGLYRTFKVRCDFCPSLYALFC